MHLLHQTLPSKFNLKLGLQVAAIVTHAPSSRDSGKKVLPSPVAQYALDKGLPSHLIFSPEKAGDEAFLSALRELQPALCITAGYGNTLPTKFLKIPVHGTMNMHPSLLPLYRGAAPVQRALQDGVPETGVTLAFTVRKLDSGPMIASKRFQVDDLIKAPELLSFLVSEGSKLLIRELSSILDGSAKSKAVPQDDSKATLAPKLAPDEAWLSFNQEAFVLHNKVRAFAGWPGTCAKFVVFDDKSSQEKVLELKIITTRVCQALEIWDGEQDYVTFKKGSLMFPCKGDTALEVISDTIL
ncbi:unnamed protein product [Arabidopsis halleri]